MVKPKVQVWIVCIREHERYFLLLKTHDRRGSHWQPVTGGVERGESWRAGALREAYEETGLRLEGNLWRLGYEFSYDGRWGRARETIFVAVLRAKKLPHVRVDHDEHQAHRWVREDRVPQALEYRSNRIAFARVLERLSVFGRELR